MQDYAKSSVYVARHHMSVPGGDLLLARDYLERVAGSNAEEVALAADLLKKVKTLIQERAQQDSGAEAKTPVKVDTEVPSAAVPVTGSTNAAQ
jgi:anaphase-promoting complex subunit 8